MEDIHRRVLINMTKQIVENLSEPVVMARVSLAEYLTDSDKEAVSCEADRFGVTRANQVLVGKLEKRGPRIFEAFVEALRSQTHKRQDLAKEIEEEEARLSGVHRSEASHLHTAETESVSRNNFARPDLIVARGAPTNQQSKTQRPQESQRQTETDRNRGVNSTKQAEAPGINMLLKDIPGSVYQTIIRSLSAEDSLGKDWRAIAGCMELSASDIKTLSQDKMKGLFEEMIHKNMRVEDLVGFLVDENVVRLDIIEELKTAGLVTNSDIDSLTGASSLNMVSPSEDAAESTLSSPQQEQINPEFGKYDDTARHPVEQDSSDKANVMSPGSAGDKPPSIPQQDTNPAKNCGVAETHPVQTDNPKDKANVLSPGSAGDKPPSVPQQDTNPAKNCGVSETHPVQTDNPKDDEDSGELCLNDLKIPEESDEDKENVSKRALLIGCLKYDKLDDLENLKPIIKSDLHHVLDDAEWEPVIRKISGKDGCSSTALRRVIQEFIDDSKDEACLVYLAGHTVQINGETYLLPTDIQTDMPQADVVEASVNINKLISSLSRQSRLSLVFVDGAHQCSQQFQSAGVLEGFSAVIPLPNIVVAFPCRPGTVRPETERLHYITSLVEQLKSKGLSLEDLFSKIREELKTQVCSPPLEYSLTRSGLPFCLNPPEEGSDGLQRPDVETSRHAIIFANSQRGSETSAEDLRTSLGLNDWFQVEKHENLKSEEIKTKLRRRLRELSDHRLKVVMIYFIGAAFQTESGENVLASGVDGSHVRVQWIVDLMCELINGPKLLVVDDVQTSRERGLADMIAPQECLISLPRASDCSDRSPDYTRRLAEIIGINQGRSISQILTFASGKEHQIYRNLFFA